MKFEVRATIDENEVYAQLFGSIDIVSIFMRLHDSRLEDKDEYSEFQRAELKYAIDLLIKRRNKQWEKEKKK